MRWLVEAADTKTGQETAITVEALTEADAERIARYNGLLVSRVLKAGPPPAPVVPYAGPLREAAPPQRQLPHVARRARAAGRVGLALVVIGWVALVVAVTAFTDTAVRHRDVAASDWRAWLLVSADAAWRPIALALGAHAAGTALRLLAAAALALCPGTPADMHPAHVAPGLRVEPFAGDGQVADATTVVPPDRPGAE
jgi:hypothetical protein